MRLFAPLDILIAIFVFCAFFVGAQYFLPDTFSHLPFRSAKNFFSLQHFVGEHDRFLIFADGEEIEFPLSKDTTVTHNSVEIRLQNQTAQIVKSDCRNQICINMGVISLGQIVCLPQRVMVSVIRTNKKKERVRTPRIDVYVN